MFIDESSIQLNDLMKEKIKYNKFITLIYHIIKMNAKGVKND